MKQIKSIAFKLELKGNGVVNYDGNNQKFFLQSNCGLMGKLSDNMNFAKKVFKKKKEPIVTVTSKGKEVVNDTDYSIKISSECLRHSIFENDVDVMSNKILMSDYISAFYLTSIHSLLRGYTVLTKSNTNMVRKSCLTIPCAVDDNAVPFIELHSNAEPKEKLDNEKGSTSLRFVEHVGDTHYVTKGFISLRQMEFSSCDEFFGRLSFNPEWLEGKTPLLSEMFMKHYGRVPYKVGYYSATTATMSDMIGEYGLKYDNEFIIYQLKELLKRMLNINIKRTGAFAMTDTISVKFITDDIENANLDNDDDWIEINEEFINNLDNLLNGEEYSLFNFYKELSEDEIKKTRSEIDKLIKK